MRLAATNPVITASLEAGRALFDGGRFHEAHDAWEPGWRAAHGTQRAVMQSLILWAAALHQHQRGKTTGARRLLGRAMQRLGTASALGFKNGDLRDALADTWAQFDAPQALKVSSLRALRAHESEPFVELDHRARCPYCGEPVMVSIDAEATEGVTYVEDCPVCCRPWTVAVSSSDPVTVELRRSDD